MPEGPNKSEELLKRYAKERREQVPSPALHPATRRLLQGEVARQFGKQSAMENRGWSAWFGIMHGRLAIGTAFGVVVATGVCFWWIGQKPQQMEMVKADRSASESAPISQFGEADVKLKAEKQIADALTRDQPRDEARRRLALAPTEKVEALNARAGRSSLAGATAAERNRALNEARTVSATPSPYFKNSFGRGVSNSELALVPKESGLVTVESLADATGSVNDSIPRAYYFGAATRDEAPTNRSGVSLAYNFPGDRLATIAPQASVSAVTPTPGDKESKDPRKLSEAAKLADEPSISARAEIMERSRVAGSPPVQSPATTAQPLLAQRESVAADKPQSQLATPVLRARSEGQASASRPEPTQMARFFRQPTTAADTTSKQKTLRELERLDAEPAVLNRFVIEQNGNTVRVVDADGSVYEGKVEEPVVAEFDGDVVEALPEKKEQPAVGKSVVLKRATASQTDGYSFRASGSNITLREIVVVNGRFASGMDASRRGGAAGGGLGSLPASAPVPLLKGTTISNRANGGQTLGFGGTYGFTTNQPATIEGTVSIGLTNQQWFRALRDVR